MEEGFLIVFSGDKFLRFFNIKVACYWVIILPANQLSFDNFMNIRQALMMQDFIGIFSFSA